MTYSVYRAVRGVTGDLLCNILGIPICLHTVLQPTKSAQGIHVRVLKAGHIFRGNAQHRVTFAQLTFPNHTESLCIALVSRKKTRTF